MDCDLIVTTTCDCEWEMESGKYFVQFILYFLLISRDFISHLDDSNPRRSTGPRFNASKSVSFSSLFVADASTKDKLKWVSYGFCMFLWLSSSVSKEFGRRSEEDSLWMKSGEKEPQVFVVIRWRQIVAFLFTCPCCCFFGFIYVKCHVTGILEIGRIWKSVMKTRE